MFGYLLAALHETVLESVHTFLGSFRYIHGGLHICQSCLEVCDCKGRDSEGVVDEEGLAEGCGSQTYSGKVLIVRCIS